MPEGNSRPRRIRKLTEKYRESAEVDDDGSIDDLNATESRDAEDLDNHESWDQTEHESSDEERDGVETEEGRSNVDLPDNEEEGNDGVSNEGVSNEGVSDEGVSNEDVSNEDEENDALSVVSIELDPDSSDDNPDFNVPDGIDDDRNSQGRHHYRNMYFDEEKRRFTYEMDGYDPSTDDGVPKMNQWTKVHPRQVKQAKVTFNKGRETMLQHIDDEYKALEKRLDHLKISKDKEGLFQFVFGPKSLIANILTRALDIDFKELCKFLSTVYFAARFGVPPGRLKDDEDVKYDGYMDLDRYNEIWKRIGEVGRDGSEEMLWVQLEDAINKTCRELFLSEGFRAYLMRMAIDDDKVHHHFSSESVRKDGNYLCGMKGCQHTKANVRGFTIDTAVSAASGHPLHFRVLRQGCTNEENYYEMIKFMFAHRFSRAESMHLALDGAIFCSDRGYWSANLILRILGLGGVVFGTLKRMFWVPFTYDQKPPLHGREEINKKLGRSVFNAYTRWGDRELRVSAWRSGTGNVALAMNSDNGGEEEPIEIDFCFKSYGDGRWYKSSDISQLDRDLKAIPIGSVNEEKLCHEIERRVRGHLDYVTSENVTMLTISDLDFVWFVLRMFAWTSSQVYSTLRKSAPMILPEEPIFECFEDILTYAGLDGNLRRNTANEDGESVNDEATDEMSGPFVKGIVKSIIAIDSLDANTIDKCKTDVRAIEKKLNSKDLDQTKLIPMLVALGISHDNAGKFDLPARKKRLKSFIKSVKDLKPGSAYRFPYDKLLYSSEIESELRNRVGSVAMTTGQVPGPNGNPKNKAERIQALHYLDKNPSLVREFQDTNSDLQNAIVAGFISKSFLKALEGGEKSACRLGHQNEVPYLRQYFADSIEGIVPGVKLCDIRKCGLAMKKSRPYVRDTADALAFEETEHDTSYEGDDFFDHISSHAVELKCRSGAGYDGSLARAYRIQKKVGELSGSDGMSRAVMKKSVYLTINSSQRELLAELIPDASERIQILHHAYTYGIKRTAFLVGGPHRNILYGLIVTFEDDLLENYGKALDHLYENGLKQFYEDDVSNLPLEYIESVILGNDTIGKKFNLDDFMTLFLTWRALLPTKINKHPPKFPIPACNMQVPLDYSTWNSSKGGSDTATRYTYNCQIIVPNKTPQAKIIARILSLYAVVFHRPVQAVTGAKKLDLNKDTIKSIRNRNNKRQPFHKSLQFISKSFWKLANADEQTAKRKRSDNEPSFIVERAEKYRKTNEHTRCDYDTSLLGSISITDATPRGRGAKKNVKNRTEKHDAFDERADNCAGKPIRLVKEVKDKNNLHVGYDFDRATCDLCGQNEVMWFCSLCKRTLCFDKDRSTKLADHLKHLHGRDRKKTQNAEKIIRMVPEFELLGRNDKPSVTRGIGPLKGRQAYTYRSCFHYCHPKFLQGAMGNQDDETEIENDDQLFSIANAASSALSPHPEE